MKTVTAQGKASKKLRAILKCSEPGCKQTFRGALRAVQLGLHRRHEHGITGTSRSATRKRMERRTASAASDFIPEKTPCPDCGLNDFKSQGGLNTHITRMHGKSKGGKLPLNGNAKSFTATTTSEETEIDTFSFTLGQLCTRAEDLIALASQREGLPEDVLRNRLVSFLRRSGSSFR